MNPLSKKTGHLVLFITLIGGSFYLGVFMYPHTIALTKNEVQVSSVKEFGPIIDRVAQKELVLEAGESKITVKSSELQKWIESYYRRFSEQNDKRLAASAIKAYLESLSPKLNKEAVNAKLRFQNSKADVFVPSTSGRKLNVDHSTAAISTAVMSESSSVSLVFETIEPEITLERINNLGIKTLLAKGKSDYGKSPSSRINNIKVGMAKFNGTILKPGEEFSFNDLLGEVEPEQGYQAELVIKNGQLVREYGGGLCQVSTTIFRAAISAGFPILERKPHSFPVQYYNPQGFDSTVYPGVVDLRFKNDTENHVLIQTKVTGSALTVEIYGSDDGRKVEIEGPFQYDQRANGAMKAYFTRKITKGEGPAKEERFNSIYKAPPASPLERNPLE